MGESTIPNPNMMPSYSGTNPGTGTSNATCIQCHQIRFGKMVFLSARIQINNTITSAMDSPLLTLYINVPNYSTSTSGIAVPSIVRVGNNIYADLVSLKYFPNGTWFATQGVSSTLSQGATVEMFMVYEAV